MGKTTKLIIAAVGLGGLGYFLYKKGLFGNNAGNTGQSTTPAVQPKKTVKNPPVCDAGYKLAMVNINCQGQDCEVHCIPIPAATEEKLSPIPVVKKDEPFKAIPDNPTIFYPYTTIPVEVVVNPYVGVPQNPDVPVTDNTFKPVVVVVEQDPFETTGRGKGSLDYELNQILYR